MQSNTFYKYEQDFLNVNPCLTCNFVQPTPLSFLHQLSPVMPTFSVDEIAWQNTSLCSASALNEVLFLEIWTDVRAKRKCNILWWRCSVVLNMLLSHNLSRLLYTSWFVSCFLLAILMSSSVHEIIIPRTSLSWLHSNIVSASANKEHVIW